MSVTKLLHNLSFHEGIKIKRRERSFELPLSVYVTEVDSEGNKFQEQTELSAISSQEAAFWLN